MAENLPAEQGSLFDDPALEKQLEASDKARGFFTGDLVEKNDPVKYKAIVDALQDGTASQRQIARWCQCSRNTVRVVFERIAQSNVEPLRRKLAADNFSVASLTNDRMKEMLLDDDQAKKIPFQQLAVAQAVAIDKGQLLTGEATQRIEHVQGPSREDFERQYEDSLKEADVIEVGPAMRSEGGEKGQRAGAAGEPGGEDPGRAGHAALGDGAVRDDATPDDTSDVHDGNRQ